MLSRYGRTPEQRLWQYVTRGTPEECWTWTGGSHSGGYGRIKVRRRIYSAHRLVWEFTNGPIPDRLHVLHRCDNPSCVNPGHLYLGTHADNMRDKVLRGRANPARGEAAPAAKLTVAKVLEIRRQYAAGEIKSIRAKAKAIGMSHFALRMVVHNKTWTMPEAQPQTSIPPLGA